MIDEFDTPLRLFKAEMLLRRSFTAKELLKVAGLAKDDSDDEEDDEDEERDGESGSEEKGGGSGDDGGEEGSGDNSDFNSKHPRWPAGSPGGIGGEFAPKDAGEATAALHDGIAADALAVPLGSNIPAVFADGQNEARSFDVNRNGSLDNNPPTNLFDISREAFADYPANPVYATYDDGTVIRDPNTQIPILIPPGVSLGDNIDYGLSIANLPSIVTGPAIYY